jgi:citrate lyase subunit beta / citryl-CoA lyase
MTSIVQRSMLIMPAHVPRFVEKAFLRGADAIVLDLEDAVPADEKVQARAGLPRALYHAGRGGADVFVRINNDDSRAEDIHSAVRPGLHGLFIPKVESKIEVQEIDTLIAQLERDRGLASNSVKIALHIESPRGLVNLQEIVASSGRAESLSLGADDYCLEMGIEPSDEGAELVFPLNLVCAYARTYGLAPIGIVGRVANLTDMATFRRAAERAKAMGFVGGYCVHPDQVAVLNEVFSPTTSETEAAGRIAAAFESAVANGRAAVRLDGVMVDTPVYKRALVTLERAKAVAARNAFKASAVSASGERI